MSDSLLRIAIALIVLGAAVAVFAWLPSGCTPMVNHFAFYPEAGPPLGPGALGPGADHVRFSTEDGETIEGYLISATRHPGRLVLYFHGNAGNVAQRLPELREIAARTGAAVFGSGYRGYGASTGTPSENGIYRDGEAALRHAREILGFPCGRIVLVGRSIGSTVATHLAASGDDFAGVILVTPLSTGRDFGRAHLGPVSLMAGRSFDSLGRAASIREPVLVLHGLDDTVIPYEHGRRLFEALPGPKRLVLIPGAGHNNLDFVDAGTYWGALAAFVLDPAAATERASAAGRG